MSYESRAFKKAEMACELAHEDREYNTPTRSAKATAYSHFKRLKAMNRDHTQELQFIAYKRRYNWY